MGQELEVGLRSIDADVPVWRGVGGTSAGRAMFRLCEWGVHPRSPTPPRAGCMLARQVEVLAECLTWRGSRDHQSP